MNPFQETMSSKDSLDTKLFSFNETQDPLLLQDYQQLTPMPNNNLTGVYSNTGFDMIQILSRLIHR